MQTSRFDDWENRLSVYLATVENAPHQWGSHDGALFASSAVEAVTGYDFFADLRDLYTSRAGLCRALKALGLGTLIQSLDARIGGQKPASQAKRGDVVMHGGAPGICCGQFSRFVGPTGLIFTPTLSCQRAWTV